MTWTQLVLLCVMPVHATLGFIALLMVYPFGPNYVLGALVVGIIEPLAYAAERLLRARPDPEHRAVSWVLWVTATLSPPMSFRYLGIALGGAALWRLTPRAARPVVALGSALALAWLVSWHDAQTRALQYTYATLYGTTGLLLLTFAVERSVRFFQDRHRGTRLDP